MSVHEAIARGRCALGYTANGLHIEISCLEAESCQPALLAGSCSKPRIFCTDGYSPGGAYATF
jgi:hypothetical protein